MIACIRIPWGSEGLERDQEYDLVTEDGLIRFAATVWFNVKKESVGEEVRTNLPEEMIVTIDNQRVGL